MFDPRDNDVARRIHELTGGAGVDVAIELAGVYPALQYRHPLRAQHGHGLLRRASTRARRTACTWAANGTTIG